MRISCTLAATGSQAPFSSHDAKTSFQLCLSGIRFTISGGDTIQISAPVETDPADIRVYLLGSVMAALLNQRGILTIHANVVRSNSGAAAFAGPSGAGKSTLAAWFDERGYEVLCDDLCAFTLGAGGASVLPGIPRTKLWRETLEAFGRSAEGLVKVASDIDKFNVPLRSAGKVGSLEPVRLTRIYILEWPEQAQTTTVEPLRGIEAAQALLANAFRWEIGQLVLPSPSAQFDQYLALARAVSVLRVRRPRSMAKFDEGAREIERHLAEPLPR